MVGWWYGPVVHVLAAGRGRGHVRVSSLSALLLSFSLTCTVAHLVGSPLYDKEVAGMTPGQIIPKTFKMILAALLLTPSIKKIP